MNESLISRKPGMYEDGYAEKPAADETDLMDDADQENLGFAMGRGFPVTGDCADHLEAHARFAETPLGRAMSKAARMRLQMHMLGHIDELFSSPAEERKPDIRSAADMVGMIRDFRQGATAEKA